MKWMKRLLKLLAVVLVGLLILGIYWNQNPAKPTARAEAVLQSVTHEDGTFIFMPEKETPTTGFIFYQGGRVDTGAYAVPLDDIAEQGFAVFAPEFLFDLAVTSPNKAEKIIEAYPDIDHWIIGGHSLGGVMAATFAENHPDLIDGVVFWASYPTAQDDLSDNNIPVLSIAGSLDYLSTQAKIDARKDNLPTDTEYLIITGGNHAQFGDYGEQGGDGVATISIEEQQREVVGATAEFLRSIE